MTVNQKKVFECLVDKRLRDKVDYGHENSGWMGIRDITSYCNFDNHSVTVGCLINLTKKKLVEVEEEETIDGMKHKYYRVNPNLSIVLTYDMKPNSSWDGDPATIDELNNFKI